MYDEAESGRRDPPGAHICAWLYKTKRRAEMHPFLPVIMPFEKAINFLSIASYAVPLAI